MKIIFFGSDDFAVVNLEAILDAGYEVVACVTAPDKPKGRGMHVAASPVKEFAHDKGITVLQPTDLGQEKFIQALRKYAADLFVVIAYGKLLPPAVLRIPSICSINSHGSLLPKYRGAAPINWAIINGETETGVSIIKLNPQMDAGDIVTQARLAIDPSDTAVILRHKLAVLSAKVLVKTIELLGQGKFTLAVQKREDVTFAPKLKKEHGLIDWKRSALEIDNLVRGLLPWPTAYSYLNGKLIKVLEAEVTGHDAPARPGDIIQLTPRGIVVATGKGALILKKVHPESAKPMSAADFIHGHKIVAGMRMGPR